MTKSRTRLWLAVNAVLLLLALYTTLIDSLAKAFPESRSDNMIIAVEGIAAWIASFVVWRLRCSTATGSEAIRQRTTRISISLLYLAGFAFSLALYALRVLHSDYR